MSARDVWILYLHEIRSALRERSIVVYSLLIPAVLYPALLWLAWTGAMFVSGQAGASNARVALLDVPAAHAEIERDLAAEKGIQIIKPEASRPRPSEASVRAGELDAILEWSTLADGSAGSAGAPGFTVKVIFDGSKARSRRAAEALEGAARDHRERWLLREAERLGVPRSAWSEARFEGRSVASRRDMGAFLLSLVIPLVLLVMISIGCFYPAIDATAGERERSTWETLMSVGASRSSIVAAKYLYVATFGAAAGVLNLGAMVLSLRAIVASALGEEAGSSSFEVPLSAIPLTLACAALMSLLLAAAMMILASFARTFKEGQAMITPFYLAVLMPSILLQSPDSALSPATALIPVVNVALVFREAISGTWRWPLIGLATAAQLGAIALCIFIGSRMLAFEDTIAGSMEGDLGARLRVMIRRRLHTRARARKEGSR